MSTAAPGYPSNLGPSDPGPGDAGCKVRDILQRLLRHGRLDAFPTHPEHLDALLATAAAGFARRRPYAEREVNDLLIDWLASVRARPDHVSLRRRMVDCGFLKRSRDGARYFLNYGRLAGVLGDPAAAVDAAAILADRVRELAARKAARAGATGA